MDTKLKVPQAPKAKVMLWTDVGYNDMGEIDKTQSIPDLESILCSVLAIDLPEPRRGVLLELYVQTVLFCRKHSFKKEQTSALLSIIKSTHEANIETPLNNKEQCLKYCKELLLCHSVRRPPFSINFFSHEEVTCIFDYIYSSYMRHYKLYKYIFTPRVKLDLSFRYSGISDKDEPTMENFSASGTFLEPDVENLMEKEEEAVQKTDGFLQTQEASVAEPEGNALSSKSELKAMIEMEVKEQMVLLSGQLDQQIKKIVNEHSRAPDSPQLDHKTKK